jgi:hypothetical protein
MVRVFVLYRLRPEIDPQRYEEWSQTRDQPVMKAAESVLGLRLYRVQASGGGASGFTYVEIIDVTSRDAFERDLQTPKVKVTAAEWARQVMDKFQILYADEVE